MDSSDEENALLESEPEATKSSVKSEPSTQKSKQSQTISSSTRLMRNLAEKMRRDKLNMHISDLASIVPMVATATKRVDKTSVLRLSAAYLRIHQNLINGADDKYIWQPYFLHDINLSGLLLEAVNGFMLVIALSGKIIYVSEGIDKLLGHSPVDVLGHSIYTIIHPDDYSLVQKQLQSGVDNQRRSFCCHMVERSLSRNDCGRYSLVHMIGHIRTSDQVDHDEDYGTGIPENLLIAIVKVIKNQPITEISWTDGCHDEYITQHSMDARIICADHRISIIAGYLPDEVVGKSAYEYMYERDRLLSVFAHRQFLTDPKSAEYGGTAVYRLRTGANTLIHLKSQGLLQYNSSTGKPETFICINKLLSSREGNFEMRRLYLRYSPSVTNGGKENGNSISEPSSKSLKWTTTSSSCSDSSEVPEIPSTLEEEQWSSLSVPFPLSLLPSNTSEKKPSEVSKQSAWKDEDETLQKAAWQDGMVNEAAYTEDSSHSASKRSHCNTASYAGNQSREYFCVDLPNDPYFDNVTSTTSDNDLTLTEAPSIKEESSLSTRMCVVSKAVSNSKRTTKRRAQENRNDSFSPDRIEDYHSTSKSGSNSSSQTTLAHTPSKKRCNRVEQCATKSVYNISKVNRNHPR